MNVGPRCHVRDDCYVQKCLLINTIQRHYAAHHSQPIMIERNIILTCPVAGWYMGASDPDRALRGRLFSRYDPRFVKPEFATDPGTELDARAKPA